MKTNRLFPLVVAVGALLTLTATGCSGSAEGDGEGDGEYPSKPVTFLTPYAPGGPSDTTARAYAACLGNELDATFVVENQPSGAGAVAMQQLASAKPDGYTVGLSTNGPLVLNPMTNDLTYTLADFTALGTMAEIPTIFAVGKDSPYKDAQALFEAAKANPGKISIGVPGATSSLATELKRLQKETGIEFAMVPTGGSAEIITNLRGGHIDAAFINDHADVEAQVKAGEFVPLAAAGEERSKAYPEIPTTAEVGYDVRTTSVYGLFAPKGLPTEVADTLESGVETCSKDADVISQIGDRFVPETFSNAAETTAIFKEMHARWQPVLAE